MGSKHEEGMSRRTFATPRRAPMTPDFHAVPEYMNEMFYASGVLVRNTSGKDVQLQRYFRTFLAPVELSLYSFSNWQRHLLYFIFYQA